MADVKIVDIDNEQWNIKDQEARTRIATLEEKTTVNITKKIDQTVIKMNLVEINGEKFVQLHINGLSWAGVIGSTIATFTQDFDLDEIIRCVVGLDFTDGTGRDTAGIDIEPGGVIRIYPHTPNQMSGTYRACNIYGDAFIRVAH